METVHLLCGRLCSGKSHYAAHLREENGAVVLSVDELMLALFGPDAGELHDEYARRAKEYLFRQAVELSCADVPVVLDWGFWTRESRRAVREAFAARSVPTRLYWLDVDGEEWKARIQRRNEAVLRGETRAYLVDEGLLKKFSSLFEPPLPGEIDVTVPADKT